LPAVPTGLSLHLPCDVSIGSSALGASERAVNVATGNTRPTIGSSGSSRATSNIDRVTVTCTARSKLTRSLTYPAVPPDLSLQAAELSALPAILSRQVKE